MVKYTPNLIAVTRTASKGAGDGFALSQCVC